MNTSHSTLLLLIGVALGPSGLALLTPEVLRVLDPAVPVALAVLGVAAVFGSATPGGFSRGGAHVCSFLIVATGLAVALRQGPSANELATVGQAAGIAALLAVAGRLLSSGEAGNDERRVASIAIFLLLGGVADYLAVSSLLLGWIAATVWRLRDGGLSDVRVDAAYVQHPMTALLLITAGAHVQFSWQAALVAAAAVCVMTAVVLILHREPAAALAPDGMPLTLPAFAVALAMDATRLDSRLTLLLSVVALSALALDTLAGRTKEDLA